MGVGPPITLGIVARSAVGGLDFTRVTSVVLYPQRPDGTEPSPWTATLAPAPDQVAITPVRAVVQYPFQTPDLDLRGLWKVQVVFITPDGPWPGDPKLTPEFTVTDKWGQ